jgi:acetate kinase
VEVTRVLRTNPPVLLVINAGSSSIKYQLIEMAGEQALAGGVVDRIGSSACALSHWTAGQEVPLERKVAAGDHREGLAVVRATLAETGLLTDAAGLTAIGHRVVHGGEEFSAPVLIDDTVEEAIRRLCRLAPLHNPANLLGIEVCRAPFPGVPQVAVFDTAFHQSMPAAAYRYALPEGWYSRNGVRRYGFHGTSHRYVAEQAARLLGRPLDELRLITLHLGNGASAAAIAAGRCVDTSMGLTPLEGLVMGTRCGDIDPAIPAHLQRVAGLTPEAIDRALNQESGLLGLCGSSDMREVLRREAAGDARATLAVAVYVHRIKRYVGAFLAVLGGADALVFTGGIGENAARIRALACSDLERLGIALDPTANQRPLAQWADLSRAGMPVSVLAVRTNEELQIAREALAVVQRTHRPEASSAR